MQRYRYQHGDRPLDGYTIQRASGRGGFGEVYYALSDSGREVAIKAVQSYEQIELRGITQCMNLKSPHLVTIFDVKHNNRGEPFVIMEYISGPSLRTLLAESPGGLGAQKAAFFIREIAKGLSYLHNCGIVHRDLKPGNIFYENGYVKVGDYGLTKAISNSCQSGQTITVGTVQYMAPEIGEGKYNFSIDIYALGVLLYEMLTGDVPFNGASPAEILMKHMTAVPELNKIEEPFVHVIKKALAKDPKDRYQTVQEMVEDLFGEENIRNSVSCFSPEELSIIAERVAKKANIDEQPKTPPEGANTRNQDNQFAQAANKLHQHFDRIGNRITDKVDARVDAILSAKNAHIPGLTDPIQPAQRYMLAFLSMIFVSVGAGFLQSVENGNIFITAMAVFILTNICSIIILAVQMRWFVNLEPSSRWIEKVIISFIIPLICVFVFPMFGFGQHSNGSFLLMFLFMFLIDWRRISMPNRQKRLSLGSALWAGLIGAIAGQTFGGPSVILAAVMSGTSLVVQTISVFGIAGPGIPIKQQKVQRQNVEPQKTQVQSSLNYRIVPKYVRFIFLAGSFLSLGFGLFLLILAGVNMHHNRDEFALAIGVGVDSLILSVFFLIGFYRCKFTGWYRYIIKPVILLLCVFVIILSSVCMGCLNFRNDAFALSLFFIIFPAILFIFVSAIPSKAIVGNVPRPIKAAIPQAKSGVSPYRRTGALALTICGLFGLHGIQRFYVGKIGTGCLWFFTFGLFGIGQIIDFILILTGNFKDCNDLPLLIWHDKAELQKRAFSVPPPAPENKIQIEQKELSNENPPVPEAAPEPEIHAHSTFTAPASTIIYEPFHPFAFLCSGVGCILIFLTIVVGLAVGLGVPYLIASGWPNQNLPHELERFFGDSSWPSLLVHLGEILTYALLLLAAVFITLGRRHLGARHLIRALLGFVSLILAFSALFEAGASRFYYEDMVNLLNSRQYGPAIERMLSGWRNEIAFISLVLFLVSIVILAWPARKQNIIVPPVNQGVSL
jgi:serine/threonine protein kinase